ncbi:MAG TPA: hypothetical protein VGV40_04290 [Solirubrobacteraceae bacterium]|nr:hypothetical protein [Solirubrobacteraceae bacterium]
MNPQEHQPSEEELQAAYEAEMKRIHVEDVLVQTVVSLLNLGGRKAGLVPDTESERDPQQLGQAIEGVRALLPLVEDALGDNAGQLREALSQLQMAYARLGGPAPDAPVQRPQREEQSPAPQQGGGPGQSSGRLWVPGQ